MRSNGVFAKDGFNVGFVRMLALAACILAGCDGIVALPGPSDVFDVADKPELETGRRNTVTTSLTFPMDPSGELRARFQARDLGDGTWDVEATFRPREVVVCHRYCGICECTWHDVRGAASTTVTALPEVAVQMTAPGIYYTRLDGVRISLGVFCTFTVAADGVVAVQGIGIPH